MNPTAYRIKRLADEFGHLFQVKKLTCVKVIHDQRELKKMFMRARAWQTALPPVWAHSPLIHEDVKLWARADQKHTWSVKTWN